MLETGVYLSASCFLAFETRKTNADFGIMVIHHAVTITLLFMGWSIKLYNYSIGIAALHDISDVILEYSKIFYYKKFQKTSDVTFTVFTITFMVSRLFVFPKFFILLWYNGKFK
jgi:ceramide synthetase